MMGLQYPFNSNVYLTFRQILRVTDEDSISEKPWYDPLSFSLISLLLLKGITFILLTISAAGDLQCGGPKKSPRTSRRVQIIFSFWSFEITH